MTLPLVGSDEEPGGCFTGLSPNGARIDLAGKRWWDSAGSAAGWPSYLTRTVVHDFMLL